MVRDRKSPKRKTWTRRTQKHKDSLYHVVSACVGVSGFEIEGLTVVESLFCFRNLQFEIDLNSEFRISDFSVWPEPTIPPGLLSLLMLLLFDLRSSRICAVREVVLQFLPWRQGLLLRVEGETRGSQKEWRERERERERE